jgi:hypothetical protein
MAEHTPLSPAAQAVINAAVEVTGYGKETPLLCARIAAALRAVADQASYCLDGSAYYVVAKYDLLAIAAELEGNND